MNVVRKYVILDCEIWLGAIVIHCVAHRRNLEVGQTMLTIDATCGCLILVFLQMHFR